MKHDLREILSELEHLARMISRMPDLQVHAGRPGSGYSFNHRTRTVSLDQATLFSQGSDFNRGLVLHETAHAVMTRIHRHATSDHCRLDEIRIALNCVEDARIENWLWTRFPGSRAWMEDYNGKLLRNTVPEMRKMLEQPATLPPLQELAASLMAKWWHGDAIKIPERCRPLLEELWPWFDRVVNTHPPVSPDGDTDQRYDRSGTKMLYFADDIAEPPSTWEKAVRLSQFEAWALIEEGMLPVFKRLAPLGVGGPAPRAFQMLMHWLESWSLAETDPHSSGSPRISARLLRGVRGKSDRAPAMPWKPCLGSYNRLALEQADAIDTLVQVIQDTFPPERGGRWTGQLRSGIRLRLKDVFQAEGNPRRSVDIWEKPAPPVLPKPHLFVLIDRSGSMEKERRMENAAAGAVLLVETSRRASLPLSLFTFADRCHLILDPSTDPETAAASVGGLVNAASGGTDMALALDVVAKKVEESRAPQRFVVVLGDGEDNPEGVRPILDRLEKKSGTIVVALGVGEATDGMKACFQRAMTGLSASAIPAALAATLRGALHFRR